MTSDEARLDAAIAACRQHASRLRSRQAAILSMAWKLANPLLDIAGQVASAAQRQSGR